MTQRLEHDLQQYAQLDHSNLLPFLGMTRGFGLLPAIVTPWMHNGSLTMFLEHDSQDLANNTKLQIVGVYVHIASRNLGCCSSVIPLQLFTTVRDQ